jgi:DNA-binding transcriptional LysR family regulator
LVNFSHLKAFYEVAKNKSFTLAASELSVSQPTISMQVQALEKYYNVPLLKRTKKGIELTDPGQKTFSFAQKIFSISDDLDKYLIELDQFKSGTLKIASTRQLAQYFVPGIVFKLRELNPELKLELYTSLSIDIVNKINDMVYHAGIIGRVPYPDHITFQPIFRPKLYFITTDKMEPKIPLKKLSNYPIILTEEGSATRAYIIGEFHKRGIPLNNCVSAQNPSAIRHMVHLGIGGAFFPSYSIEEDVKKGKYNQIAMLEDLYMHVDLIYLDERSKSTAISNLVSIVKATPFRFDSL